MDLFAGRDRPVCVCCGFYSQLCWLGSCVRLIGCQLTLSARATPDLSVVWWVLRSECLARSLCPTKVVGRYARRSAGLRPGALSLQRLRPVWPTCLYTASPVQYGPGGPSPVSRCYLCCSGLAQACAGMGPVQTWCVSCLVPCRSCCWR
jgi:hypothetical protein